MSRMSCLFLILTVAIICIADTNAQRRCPRGEFWTDCGSCQPTCAQPVIEACIAVCQRGCYCNRGRIRREKNGPCIPIGQCP